MKREDVLRSPEYWFEHAQNELYDQVVRYMEREQISQTQLAKKLNVSKSYVSQILNGNFNYTLKRLIELGLAIGVVPRIYYQRFEGVNKGDRKLLVDAMTKPPAPRAKLKRAMKRHAEFGRKK